METGGCLKQLDVFSFANNLKVFRYFLRHFGWHHEDLFERPEETVDFRNMVETKNIPLEVIDK